jgi:hypothetical protein
MKLSEFKEWINNLPEDLEEFPFVIRDIQESEDKNFSFKDEPVMSVMVDKQTNRICLHGLESQKKIELIREKQKEAE